MRRALCVAALAVLLGALPAMAQTRLFGSDSQLKIILEAPFPALVRTAKTKPDPYDATLTVQDGAGAAHSIPLKINARGKSRRMAGYCTFPPLSLDFGEKATVKGTPFQGQGKLKLVTHCRGDSSHDQRIILEYLGYKLYNVVTPLSHRVRAAEVTYRNGPADKGTTRFAFLIEDPDDIAARNNLDELEVGPNMPIRVSQLDARATARATMFEYMIGNLDWGFFDGPPGEDCCHNAHLLAAEKAQPATATAIKPVPYDFDMSGLVDAPYAGPPPGIRLDRVTQRYYRGYCFTNGELPAVIAEFKGHKAKLMAVIKEEERLNPDFKGKATRFLEGFFTALDNPEKLESEFSRRCR
jgi:hypothetical protein